VAEQTFTISPAELEAMLERAARRSAKEALSQVGLHDDGAGNDIRDLRQLLLSWRDIRSTATRTFVKWLVMLLLGALSAGAYVTLGK